MFHGFTGRDCFIVNCIVNIENLIVNVDNFIRRLRIFYTLIKTTVYHINFIVIIRVALCNLTQQVMFQLKMIKY